MKMNPAIDSIQHVAAIIHALEPGKLNVLEKQKDWARRLLAFGPIPIAL